MEAHRAEDPSAISTAVRAVVVGMAARLAVGMVVEEWAATGHMAEIGIRNDRGIESTV